jgi:single-stranded DNA-binding protein
MPIRHATMTGVLARTPEVRRIGEKDVTTGRLAVSQGRDKPTIWLDLTCWSQWPAADLLACAKGTRVTVTGRLTLRTWTGKDGSIKEGLGLDVDAVEAPRQEAPRSDFDDDGLTYQQPNTSDDLPF